MNPPNRTGRKKGGIKEGRDVEKREEKARENRGVQAEI